MKKSNFFLSCLAAFVIVLFVYSCNNSANYDEHSSDSVSAPEQSAGTTVPSPSPVDSSSSNNTGSMTRPAPDTVATFPPEVGKSAVLGYSYPERIRRKEVKNVNAFLTVNLPESKVRDTLKKITEKQLRQLQKDDTTHILTENLILYEEVEVQLIDPGSVFTITPVFPESQKVDTIRGNRWRWSLTTTTDQVFGDLILKVTVKNPNTNPERLEDHSFQITVEVDPPISILRRSWLFLMDNPGVVVTVILIPLIAFFGKRYFDRRDKNK
jgi:hypothetical protein